jgi:F-type H+-transporting ATPase subunit delta
MRVTVDPSVVGGVRARVGDTVIDGSVARRLSQLRTRING